MDSPPHIPPESASTSTARPPPAELEAKHDEREKEMLYRTKVIQFLGRTTPIILQNDNGPCPLLAICNVLSLKNSLNLSSDIPDVSQEKLLSLVAERLIDSNINTDNKDPGYVENQQQNIADAIDLLHRLTTGIDVNIKFRRIDDFEFTPECAIFDLLDIPLYHGWIVDPQDHETVDAVGSKSYNSLMGELVSLETKIMEREQKKNLKDDNVDFVAATTATLGVPSPNVSRSKSFDDSPHAARKGDVEEEAELLRVLRLSEVESSNSLVDGVVADVGLHESAYVKKSELETHLETVENNVTDETVKTGTLISVEREALNSHHIDLQVPEVVPQEAIHSFSKTDLENTCIQPTNYEESRKSGITVIGSDAGVANGNVQTVSFGRDPPSSSLNSQDRSSENAQIKLTSTSDLDEPSDHLNDCKERDSSSLLNVAGDSHSSSVQMHHIGETEAFSSSIDGNEAAYEGEQSILDLGTAVCENREPVYEGEVVLAEQGDRSCVDDGGLNSKDIISLEQGEIIRNFMKDSASQLTVYGLFCLQDKVKERELCVFFRNNHFSTMFKYEDELYILATDQGYINQPDLVWEKLNEVNGNTVFMTSNFKEFKMDEPSDSTWNEQSAMASTTDYLATLDSAQENSSFNSDLQLAMALQQQEFEEQPPQRNLQQEQQPQCNLQQPAVTGSSRLVTGPKVSRSSGKHRSSSKQESKSKDKCTVM